MSASVGAARWSRPLQQSALRIAAAKNRRCDRLPYQPCRVRCHGIQCCRHGCARHQGDGWGNSTLSARAKPVHAIVQGVPCLAQSMSLPTACLVTRRSIAENFIGNPLLLVRERVVERLKSRGQSLHVLCVLFRDRGVGIQIINGAHLAKPLGPLHQPLFHVAGIVPHDLSEIVPLARLSRRNL